MIGCGLCLLLMSLGVGRAGAVECADFANWADAQRYYQDHPVEAAALDPDRDQWACELEESDAFREPERIPLPVGWLLLAGMSLGIAGLLLHGWRRRKR